MIQFVDLTKEGGEVFSMPSELILFAMIQMLPPVNRQKLFAALRELAQTSMVPTVKMDQ